MLMYVTTNYDYVNLFYTIIVVQLYNRQLLQ